MIIVDILPPHLERLLHGAPRVERQPPLVVLQDELVAFPVVLQHRVVLGAAQLGAGGHVVNADAARSCWGE